MTANTRPTPPGDLLADYLNGHLSHSERLRVEAALEQSSQLRDQLTFETELQTALRAEAKTADVAAAVQQTNAPDFSQIADRLAAPSRTRWVDRLLNALGLEPSSQWLRVGLPTIACACLVIGIALTQGRPQVQEFETAINSEETFTQPTLRIITTSTLPVETLEQILHNHGLIMTHRYPQGNTLDATLGKLSSDINAAAHSLRNDPRIRAVKVVSNP